MKENKSLRQFTNDLEHSKWTNYLQLKKIPKKSTLNSWFKFFKIEKIKNLVKNFLFKNKIFAIDGTGLETSKRTNYFQKRLNDFGLKTKQNYNKLDIIADIDSKLIYDFSFLEKQRHDAFIGRKLLKNFNLKNKLILGDGAYD